jgi:hypothetical protein
MPHDLCKSPVGDFHIAENDDLVQLVREECMVDGIAFFHQEMPSLFDDARPLCPDINDHNNLPEFSPSVTPLPREEGGGITRKEKE